MGVVLPVDSLSPMGTCISIAFLLCLLWCMGSMESELADLGNGHLLGNSFSSSEGERSFTPSATGVDSTEGDCNSGDSESIDIVGAKWFGLEKLLLLWNISEAFVCALDECLVMRRDPSLEPKLPMLTLLCPFFSVSSSFFKLLSLSSSSPASSPLSFESSDSSVYLLFSPNPKFPTPMLFGVSGTGDNCSATTGPKRTLDIFLCLLFSGMLISNGDSRTSTDFFRIWMKLVLFITSFESFEGPNDDWGESDILSDLDFLYQCVIPSFSSLPLISTSFLFLKALKRT